MIKLINKNNYLESYKKLEFVDKIKLSNIYFKQAEQRKLFIKNNSNFVELEINKPCLMCNRSVNRGHLAFINNFYCTECLTPASVENAKQIFINTITESENN